MKLISSRMTHFYKRVFPVLWFGGLFLFVIVVVVGGIVLKKIEEPWLFLATLIFFACLSYAFIRWLLLTLVDEVWDDGDALVVKNNGREIRIPLTECINVGYNGQINPPRMTLTLRSPSEFGDEIAFMPPLKIFPFFMPQLGKDLILRIDAAKRDAVN